MEHLNTGKTKQNKTKQNKTKKKNTLYHLLDAHSWNQVKSCKPCCHKVILILPHLYRIQPVTDCHKQRIFWNFSRGLWHSTQKKQTSFKSQIKPKTKKQKTQTQIPTKPKQNPIFIFLNFTIFLHVFIFHGKPEI